MLNYSGFTIAQNLYRQALSSTVRKVITMVNTGFIGEGKKSEKSKAAGTLALSKKSTPQEVVADGEPLNLSPSTTQTATTVKPSMKTSNGLDLPALRLSASLIAGSLADWTAIVGARAKAKTIRIRQKDGSIYYGIQVLLMVDGQNLEAATTADGVDFVVAGERVKVVAE